MTDGDGHEWRPSRRGFLVALGLGAAALPMLDAIRSSAAALDVGARLPAFTLPDLAGRTFRSSQLRGKVAFVDVWASWCGPCAQEFPVLNRLHTRYHAQGLEIVAISVDSDAANIRTFLQRTPGRFRILHDHDRSYVARLDPRRMPSSFIVDRRGIVRFTHGGFRSGDAAAYDREIHQLLAGI